MNVTLKVPTMAMKIVLRSPEAIYAQPEAKSPLCCALVTRLNLDVRRQRMVPEDVLSLGL